MESEMDLGDCLYDRQGNAYRVESYEFEWTAFADAKLRVGMTPVKERTDRGFIMVTDNEKKYFSRLTVDVKERKFRGDITEAYKGDLALFHECVMKTEDVEGVYVDGRNTTVKWADGSHTTVHCGEEDPFDLMLGFLLCVAKRHFGGTGRYLEVMRKNGIPETPRPTTLEIDMSQVGGVYFCA